MSQPAVNTLRSIAATRVGKQAVSSSTAGTVLKRAAQGWFLTAVAGQWIFVFYVFAFYGPLVLEFGMAGLGKTGMPGGYIPGDALGNAAVVAHLLLAVVIMGGGPLQLVPQVRARFPAFHRWSGRIYMPAVVLTGLGGLYLTWSRNAGGGVLQKIGISVDAVLIVVFAALALRYAIARNIDLHRRWALRLFMAVSAVWFFRVGLMLWVFLTGGIGIDRATFTGPFLVFLSFAQYLVPLAVLELYLRTKDRAGAYGKIAMAVALFTLTLAMGVGIYRAYLGLWLPRI